MLPAGEKPSKDSKEKVYQDEPPSGLMPRFRMSRPFLSLVVSLIDWPGTRSGAYSYPVIVPGRSGTRRHITLEPVHRPVHYVAPVFRIDKPVPLVGINNQLRRDMEIAEGMPELE